MHIISIRHSLKISLLFCLSALCHTVFIQPVCLLILPFGFHDGICFNVSHSFWNNLVVLLVLKQHIYIDTLLEKIATSYQREQLPLVFLKCIKLLSRCNWYRGRGLINASLSLDIYFFFFFKKKNVSSCKWKNGTLITIMRYIFICFPFFFLVHAAWERFCLFLAVLGRQQATTRNPPGLLSTGDYQLRTRKTAATSRSLSSFMTSLFVFCLCGENAFTAVQTAR